MGPVHQASSTDWRWTGHALVQDGTLSVGV
jgi:hypothetical protein